MGAGCSSPIRRFGKNRRRSSSHRSAQYQLDDDAPVADNENNLAAPNCKQHRQQPQEQNVKHKNKVTKSQQSEIDEDYPSTRSYTMDPRLLEECKGNNNSSTSEFTTTNSKTAPEVTFSSSKSENARAALRAINNQPAIDRHLLVSPALSPAPSTCYSPSPASISSGANCLDLIDLNETFKTITFGNLKQSSHRLSETFFNNNLLQTNQDLVNYITIVLITADNFKLLSHSDTLDSIEALLNKLETSLKPFCDEHRFNLRLVNLSCWHLLENFHVNNIVDASMSILDKEYRENSEHIMIIVLSNNSNNNDSNGSEFANEKFLPTKLEAQLFDKFVKCLNNYDKKDLLERWYNHEQEENYYYLKPIYLVYPNITQHDQRFQSWQSWLNDSTQIIQSLYASDMKFAQNNLVSLSETQVDFLMKEQTLQKQTLLIKNFPSQNATLAYPSTVVVGQQQQRQSNNLNELSRILTDPNKMVLKRPMTKDEFVSATNDWISESFCKFAENLLEYRATQGKHKPAYIDTSLFTELTKQRHELERYVKNTTKLFEDECAKIYKKQVSSIIKSAVVSSSLSNNNASISRSDSDPNSSHLIIIEGPQGCGKSTLLAQIIRLINEEIFDYGQLLYRFAGISLDSLSVNRILRSICEQFCQLQGENTTAASYIYSNRKDIMDALNKILKHQAHFIFIDNLDCLQIFSENSLEWFGELDAEKKIKVFVSVESESELSKKFAKLYPSALRIKLEQPSINEWSQLLVSEAELQALSLANSFQEDVANLIELNLEAKLLTYTKAVDIIRLCRIHRLNNESIHSKLTANAIQNYISNEQAVESGQPRYIVELITTLEYLVKPKELATLFVILDSSRNGLSEQDSLNILAMLSKDTQITPVSRYSSTLWLYLKLQLEPWLTSIVHGKVIKHSIDKSLSIKVIDYYKQTKFDNIQVEARELMYDYFTRQTPNKPTKSETIPADKGDHMSASELLWNATKTSELVNLSILTNPTKAKEQLLNKNNFFSQFLYGSMPEEFIEDYEKIKAFVLKKSSNFEDLSSLIPWVYASVYPLRYDGSQIYSQIYCRAYDSIKNSKFSRNKKLNEIFNLASAPPRRSLLPISETSINLFIKSRVGPLSTSSQQQQSLAQQSGDNILSSANISGSNTMQAQAGQKIKSTPSTSSYQSSNVMNAKQRIFTIKDNHRHVIVIFPDRGLLLVFDIYEEKAVRTLSNLDQPCDLRMIDHKRAVILCNRELRVYDLDSGELLTKLKGVMNQKMPFFEVYGENYVVALARNRMYVNMLNLKTGELETTFKVGEDRFLNSLLVSKNGGICVCGDETQKPFPLLVWNLNERRLMYDLRLNRHEFITRMSAISDDGHFVVSVCRQLGDNTTDTPPNTATLTSASACIQQPHHQGLSSPSSSLPNFIVVYDLNSGTLFKKWKPGLNSCSVTISSFVDHPGKVANGIIDGSIIIWDLATGSRRHTLLGHKAPPDVLRARNDKLFSMDSTCKDQSLRVWDMEQGYCLAVFSPDAPVTSSQISTCGNALVCGFVGEKRLCTLVMCKNETVADVIKRNKRRKSSKSSYIYDDPPPSRKQSAS